MGKRLNTKKASKTEDMIRVFDAALQTFQENLFWVSMNHMTRNKTRVAIESGKGMKVKMVKLC